MWEESVEEVFRVNAWSLTVKVGCLPHSYRKNKGKSTGRHDVAS